MIQGVTCALCSREPEDWCPACKQPLCAEHSLPHEPSFDQPCENRPPSGSDTQYARMLDAWDHHIPSAEELEGGWPDTEDET